MKNLNTNIIRQNSLDKRSVSSQSDEGREQQFVQSERLEKI
jgi:hypothetical protein